MSVKINIDIPSNAVDNIVKSNDLGLFMSATWARYLDKYVPYYEGILAQADITKPFEVSYVTPYARYQWNGVSTKGKKLNYNKEQHPLATSHWEEPAFENYKGQVAKEITEYLRRKS